MSDVVRIKPLEWMERRQDYWDATTIFGIYQVHRSSASTTTKYQIHRPGKLGWIEFPTIDDAKAACEADYRERIAPAFTSPWQPTPMPVVPTPSDWTEIRSYVVKLKNGAYYACFCFNDLWLMGSPPTPLPLDRVAGWMEIPPLEGK